MHFFVDKVSPPYLCSFLSIYLIYLFIIFNAHLRVCKLPFTPLFCFSHFNQHFLFFALFTQLVHSCLYSFLTSTLSHSIFPPFIASTCLYSLSLKLSLSVQSTYTSPLSYLPVFRRVSFNPRVPTWFSGKVLALDPLGFFVGVSFGKTLQSPA